MLYSRAHVVTSIRPMVSGASKVLCSSFAISHQSHVAAAVEVKVHAGDIPGLHAAQERLGSAELPGTSEPLRGDRSGLSASPRRR
jgi:hypothetical protein